MACYNLNGSYDCQCSAPYTGDNCDRLSDGAVAGIVVGSVVFVALLILIGVAIYWTIHNRHRGHYKPSTVESSAGRIPMDMVSSPRPPWHIVFGSSNGEVLV
jgi:hypothetical protein